MAHTDAHAQKTHKDNPRKKERCQPGVVTNVYYPGAGSGSRIGKTQHSSSTLAMQGILPTTSKQSSKKENKKNDLGENV